MEKDKQNTLRKNHHNLENQVNALSEMANHSRMLAGTHERKFD